jgi:hypothetical protein
LKGGYNLLLYITGTENDRNKALKALKGIGARVVPAGGQISKHGVGYKLYIITAS